MYRYCEVKREAQKARKAVEAEAKAKREEEDATERAVREAEERVVREAEAKVEAARLEVGGCTS